MNAETKLARQRLSELQLAEALGITWTERNCQYETQHKNYFPPIMILHHIIPLAFEELLSVRLTCQSLHLPGRRETKVGSRREPNPLTNNILF